MSWNTLLLLALLHVRDLLGKAGLIQADFILELCFDKLFEEMSVVYVISSPLVLMINVHLS